MEVPIRNTKLISKFQGIVDKFYSLVEETGVDIESSEYVQQDKERTQEELEYVASEQYLREHFLPNWQDHEGYPVEHRGISVGRLSKKFQDVVPEWERFYNYGKFELPPEIGTASSALFQWYPKPGLTGWHTNWNANAYQILFTWSENGDGFFRYYDKLKDEVVTIQDKPGWQCRWYYFGRKDELDHHCWHMCYTNCNRLTLAFKFSNKGLKYDEDATARMLRDELVNEIETP